MLTLIHGCCLVAEPWPTLMTPWTVACQAPLSMDKTDKKTEKSKC